MTTQQSQICQMSGTEQAHFIKKKQLSPVEVMDAVFERVHSLNPTLNAFCVLDEENARKSAKQAEKAVMSGDELPPLHGVPIGIKDLVPTKGIRTTFGSKIYEHYIPDEDDVCVARLKDAGGIIIGKTNIPELGYQCITDNPLFGLTRNPWDLGKTPGGSSGGSAVAVATGMTSLTIGNDGGGSLRIPTSFCGLYGIKPSFGRVPLYPGCRNPKYPGASSWETLESNGPITKTVEDSALMLSIIKGPYHMDRHSLPNDGMNYMEQIQNTDLKGLKIAYSPDWGYVTVDPAVRKITEKAVKVFEQLGCEIEIAHPGFTDPLPAFGALIARDSDLTGLRKLAEVYGEEMDPSLLAFIQKKWSAEELTDAAFVRQEVNIKMRTFMEKYDLVITPTSAAPPFEVGINGPNRINGQKVSRSHWLSFTAPFNMTGQPAANVPAGWTDDGLPIGLQIIGRHLDDSLVLRASAAFEEANPWRNHQPKLVAEVGF